MIPCFYFRSSYKFQKAKFLAVLLLAHAVACQRWLLRCGKNYQEGQQATPPEGTFPPPVQLLTPHFAFRCLPRVEPYLESDECSRASLLVDTRLTSVQFDYSLPLPLDFSLDSGSRSEFPKLTLAVELEGQRTIHRNSEFDVKSLELPLSLCTLLPRKEPYSVNCMAEIELLDGTKEIYNYTSPLLFLPDPPSGTVTKLDRKATALLTRSKDGTSEYVFPIGFYTDFGYVASNISVLDEIKSQGFNFIHHVPPFEDEVAFDAILDHLDEIELYLMYDMRHSYQDLASVERQVNKIKNRRSLLAWYTADEPDGPGDPPNATRMAYDLIHNLDGYHPVSIALNCDDHYFKEYTSGADIIMPDVYMIGNNVSFSSKYNTPCNKDFGCCGCDNCEGRFEDISNRLDNAQTRLKLLGWDNNKLLWSIPQAFGGEEFWNRAPTGREWLVQTLLSINHGARGIMSWIDPTPQDIKEHASHFASLLPRLAPYLFDDEVKFSRVKFSHLDVGTWRKGAKSLIIAANLDQETPSLDLRVDGQDRIDWILREGVSLSITGHIVFEPLGCAIFLNSIGGEDTSDEAKLIHDEL
ncbi:hypothetical protein CVT26_008217 [Gymnopilus dilepis]|uniref:Uncharacterized protein n=1 Tax=Gymnopilus dilepis TaxID=231916 RepID=A0A409XX78_9AGAR|nr:hypothetical protein CVT26_008217 [Gymnopilus dilepis]